MSRWDNLTEAEAYRDEVDAALRNALAANTVSHGGRTVVAQQISELRRELQQAIEIINRLRARAAGRVGRARPSLVDFRA